ncbi:MAG: OmpH family outer membrane protein [Paracoccaceae bacterium]
MQAQSGVIRLFIVLAIALSTFGNQAVGQRNFPTVFPLPVLILDRDILFSESQLGKAIVTVELETHRKVLDNRRDIVLAFENEEKELTELRANTLGEEFQLLSDDFDARVQAMREEQLAIDVKMQNDTERNRLRFFGLSAPYLSEIMQKYNAIAILDKRTVLLFNKEMDITAEAIKLLDIAYADDPTMLVEKE